MRPFVCDDVPLECSRERHASRANGDASHGLSQAWRVLYRIEREQVTVMVERISKHDYRA
jgi:hypothetical protein